MNRYAKTHFLIGVLLVLLVLFVLRNPLLLLFLTPWAVNAIVSAQYRKNIVTSCLVVGVSIAVSTFVAAFLTVPIIIGDNTANIGGGLALMVSSVVMSFLSLFHLLAGLDGSKRRTE